MERELQPLKPALGGSRPASPAPAEVSHLPPLPPVQIEFSDLTYSVPQGRKGSKKLLRGVSGQFRPGELTGILGPSGAGKSTLLNALAGYRTGDVSGTVLTNGKPRDARAFRRLSRYIMQEDLVQPYLTVYESLRLAAQLKLDGRLPASHRRALLTETLQLLRLTGASATGVDQLSGGERKRLAIALELLNNPPVLFLDEPTTGLDEQSGSQCVALLKALARGGRTIVCSIHTPSARVFALFDHVYVVAAGQCVFRGAVPHLVPYLSAMGLPCPRHYNPADFVIEVTSGECVGVLDRMVTAMESSGAGPGYRWTPDGAPEPAPAVIMDPGVLQQYSDAEQNTQFSSSSWQQFKTLVYRHLLQYWRNKNHLVLKVFMYLFMSFTVGAMYFQFGQDGSKTIFNFGFCFCCTIACQYVPMLPVLLQYPEEVKLLKREYFNRWYSFNAYFLATTIARIPSLVLFNTLYFVIVYLMTDQPLELPRVAVFLTTCLLIAFVAESWGMAIASYLNMVNGMFIGASSTVPFMLLAVQGMGTGASEVPILIRIGMYCSYMRHGLEGFAYAIYHLGRGKLPCPYASDEYCPYRYPAQILKETGMEDAHIVNAVIGLLSSYIVFRAASYLLLRWRLSSYRHFPALAYVGRLVKRHFTVAQSH